jgi:hypothetical protein
MSDAETLQKLFELAGKHGGRIYDEWEEPHIYWMEADLYRILFDRSDAALIPSLCRAKWGNRVDCYSGTLNDIAMDHCDWMINRTELAQCRLLLMPEPDRIPWLGRVFLGEGE